jgi:hypothetical protein
MDPPRLASASSSGQTAHPARSGIWYGHGISTPQEIFFRTKQLLMTDSPSSVQVTDAKPQYSGNLFINSKIVETPFYEGLKSMCRIGSMIVRGNGVHMFNSRQGDGQHRVEHWNPGTRGLWRIWSG